MPRKGNLRTVQPVPQCVGYFTSRHCGTRKSPQSAARLVRCQTDQRSTIASLNPLASVGTCKICVVDDERKERKPNEPRERD